MSSDTNSQTLDFDKREERLLRHAQAQQRYRQKHCAALRVQARERMRLHRAAVKADEFKKNKIAEWCRDTDADYRERKFIKKFGEDRFDEVYMPLYRIHGNKTGMLPFVKESKAQQERKLAQGPRLPSRSHSALGVSLDLACTMAPPSWLSELADPPADFVACVVPNHLDANFDNHFDFSRRRNQTYWVLFVSPKSGMYSYKKYAEIEGFGTFNSQTKMLVAWAKNCFHRHRKCGCASACHLVACPEHPKEQDLSERGGSAVVKREPSAVVVPPVRGATTGRSHTSRPPSHTPPPSPPSPVLSLFASDTPSPRSPVLSLFAPDTDDEQEVCAGLGGVRASTPPRLPAPPAVSAPAPQVLLPSAPSASASTSTSSNSGAPPSSVAVSSESSLSSSVSGATSVVEGAGERVSRRRPEDSASRWGGEDSASRRPRKKRVTEDDAFYVSSSGVIRHSSKAALADVEDGAVQVVFGWDAATLRAREVVARALGKGKGRVEEKKTSKRGETSRMAEVAKRTCSIGFVDRTSLALKNPMAVAKKRATNAGKGPPRKRSRKHEGKHRGKLGWVHGTKLVFFEARRAAWRTAKEQGSTALSKFYKDVRDLYLLKYGYTMGDTEDLEVDVDDPVDPNARDPSSVGLTEEEAKERSEQADVVKKVGSTLRWRAQSDKPLQRIAAWYCRTDKEASEQDRDIFAQVLGAFSAEGLPYPTRARPLHYFSRHFYEDKIKTRFEADFKVETQRAKDMEEELPHEIKVRNDTTKQVYLEQTDDFRQEILLGVEAEHKGAIRAWELTQASSGPAETAEQLNAVMSQKCLDSE
ncbi:hypothetical protein DFH06DRAFT_1126579 [Mycena polygramma]|nr:hypothetical protein DFH06DRAFT_1126579 [Mycena polygramma]